MSDIEDALISLPDKALEAKVGMVFMPPFIKALGFSSSEICPEYSTGAGSVDFALRHNKDDSDIFLRSGVNPQILIEIKGRSINLSEGSTQHKDAIEQIKEYLLAPNCKTAEWGIITNSLHLQLFKRHGKVIHPASELLGISPSNIGEIIKRIRQKIYSPPMALAIAVYNNKGGVGKTTTTVNLAGALTLYGKRVLVVDFDPNQKDLTNYLDVKPNKTLFSLLRDKNNSVDINDVIIPYSLEFKTKSSRKVHTFDVIPADNELGSTNENDLYKLFKEYRLKQVLDKVKTQYDYILIDSSPNWRFLSKSAITASDVVLIPTKHNNVFSLSNAAVAIAEYIPEIQKEKKDGTPVALPIFWNGEKTNDATKGTAQKAIDEIIKKYENILDLTPYFYPRFTALTQDRSIFEIPNYAYITSSAFAQIPAVYKDAKANNYYSQLAKEYFLQ